MDNGNKKNWSVADREISLLSEEERTDLQYAEWEREQARNAKQTDKWAATQAAYNEIFENQIRGGLRSKLGAPVDD